MTPEEGSAVHVPTFVFSVLDDAALLPGCYGLEDYVPNLEVKKMPNATHWFEDEQPKPVASEIGPFLCQ
ncbi:MAG: hypothetical protein Q7T87_08360 [Polaromonas sp.]|nr:hypothetical protein [Polaromonas sp.]